MAQKPTTLGVTLNGNDTVDGFAPLDIPPLPATPKLSATEERRIEEANQQASTQLEIEDAINRFRASDAWSGRSIDYRRQTLKDWTENTWPEYARQRFGQDTTAANQYKNGILNPLRAELDREERETNTWFNQAYNLYQSAGRGLDQAIDAGYAIPAILETAVGDDPLEDLANARLYRERLLQNQSTYTPEQFAGALQYADDQIALHTNRTLQQQEKQASSLAALIDQQARSAANEAVRRANNPVRSQGALRDAEILEADPEAVVAFERILSDRSLLPLANLLFEQWANIGLIAGSAAGGAALGGVAGPAGATAGGVAGAAVSGALVTAGQVVSELAQEIYEAPVSKLSSLPVYKELAAAGLSEQQIRERIAREAIGAAYPLALGLGGVAGVLGPEALVARSSVLQPLLRGGIGRRAFTGFGLGAIAEGIQEGTEEVIGNYGWNVGTGDARDLTEGAFQAAATGALVGGPLGGIGGALDTSRPTLPSRPENTPTGSEEGRAGGFAVPENVQQEPLPTNVVVNPFYNGDAVEQAAEATNLLRTANEQADTFVNDNTVITEQAVTPLLKTYLEAEALGTSYEAIQTRLADLQINLNIPSQSDLNITTLYDQMREARFDFTLPVDQTSVDNITAVINQKLGLPVQTETNTGAANASLSSFIEGRTNGADIGGANLGGPAAALGPNLVPQIIPGSPSLNSGISATAESRGISGTGDTDAGAVAANVQPNQPAGRGDGGGADGGSSSGVTPESGAGSDTGQRSGAGAAEQRTVPAGQSETAGTDVSSGTSVVGEQLELDLAERVIGFPTEPRQLELDLLGETEAINAVAIEMDSYATQQAASVVEAVQINQDDIFAQALYEAAQDVNDIHSPLLLYGNLSSEAMTGILTARLTPDILYSLDPVRNGIMMDSPSMTSRGSEEANTYTGPPSLEALVEESGSIGAQIDEVTAETPVPVVGHEVVDEDGTVRIEPGQPLTPEEQQTVDLIADAIQARADRVFQSTERGIEEAAARVKRFADVTYSAPWVAGRYARFATKTREWLVDAGASFDTWAMQFFSPVDRAPEQSPIIQSRRSLQNRVVGAVQTIQTSILNDVEGRLNDAAVRLGVDYEQFRIDAGQYQTVLHTLEAAPRQRIELEQALQEALNLPVSDVKASRVEQAETDLELYLARQAGEQNEFLLYGGRTVTEALMIKNQLEAKYGVQELAEASQAIRDGVENSLRYAVENGLIDEQTVSAYPQWAYYSPLTTEQEVGTGSVNDVSIYMPRLNLHRAGSNTPAQDAYTALYGFANRLARSVGMADFGTELNQAYLTLEARNNVTSRVDGLTYYDGMARIDVRALSAASVPDADGNVNRGAYDWAQRIRDKTDVVTRTLEKDENGNDVIRTYHILFDETTHRSEKAALRAGLFADKGRDNFSSVLSTAERATTGFAQIYTRLRPLFPIVTAARDTIERTSYLTTRTYINENGQRVYGAKIAAQMLGFLSNPVNFYNMLQYQMRGTSGNTVLDGHLNDFFASGTYLSSNYNRFMQNVRRKTVSDIEAAMPAAVRSLPRKTLNKVFDTLSAWGNYWYSLPTFAQYVKMRENDISIRDTVDGVVSLMNMQQRGSVAGKYLSPFFPFVNSIGQTAANFLNFVGLGITAGTSHPNARRQFVSAVTGWSFMIGTFATLRALTPMIAETLGDDDDGQNRLDLIPLNELGTYIPIGTGDGAYVKWPTGFGPMAFVSLAAFGADRVERGRMTPGDLGFSLLTTMGKTLVPNSAPAFAFSEDPTAFLALTFSPMLLQPIAEVAIGKNYFGQSITGPDFDRSKRASDNYALTTDRAWIDGDFGVKNIYKYTNGAIDLAPEELKALVGGYLGGVFTSVISYIESDPLYSNPNYQTTREQLGPFWTAVGATTLYNTGMNLTGNTVYAALNHYNARIKAAGIASALTLTGVENDGQGGSQSERAERHRRRVLSSAGFTPEEIDDYILLRNYETENSKMNRSLRQRLDGLFGPDMDEDAIRAAYIEWSDEKFALQTEIVNSLNFTSRNNVRRFGTPDRDAAADLRGDVAYSAVYPATIDIGSYSLPAQANGAPGPLNTVTFSDETGLQVLLPLIRPNGVMITREEAIRQYYLTGEHLGKFRTKEAAERAVTQYNSR